jgi:hypothetical protein
MAHGFQPGEHPLTGGERRPAGRFRVHEDHGWGGIALPADRPGDRVAVFVGACDDDDRSFRQAAGCGEAFVAGGRDLALMRQALQQAPDGDLMFRAELEGAGDFAFADPAAG